MRVLKKDKINYKINFCTEAEKLVNEKVNLNDIQNTEEYEFKKDNNYWRIYKTIIGDSLIEMSIRKMNYSPNNIKEMHKGNRIYERSYCYIKDTNINYMTSKDVSIGNWNGYIIENLSFQDYNINIK